MNPQAEASELKSDVYASFTTGTLMAESVGFEPTDACTSSDFKSDAINRTLPTLHMAGAEGIEPSKCQSQSLMPVPLGYTPMYKIIFLLSYYIYSIT